jgi:hypothetical protein
MYTHYLSELFDGFSRREQQAVPAESFSVSIARKGPEGPEYLRLGVRRAPMIKITGLCSPYYISLAKPC